MKNDNLSVTITLGDVVRALKEHGECSYPRVANLVIGRSPTNIEHDHVNKAIARGIKAHKIYHSERSYNGETYGVVGLRP